MKFSLQLPTDRVDNMVDFGTAEAIAEIARATEDAGYDACFVTEHPFPADEWLASGGHHALDPFVSLAVAASATSRLLLHTNILVLAYRNPFLTAKAVASLDAVSGGRVIVGTGAGYLKGEFAALGAPFDDRNDRSDDALVAMKAAWRGESVTMTKPGFEAVGNTMLPTPVQQPHPPIWVGGNSQRAIRRSVDFAQGWSPFPLPATGAGRTRTSAIESVEDLAAGVVRMKEYARERGRSEPLDVNFVPFGLSMNTRSLPDDAVLHEQFTALAEAGVTWVTLGLPTPNRSAYLESLARFAETFLPVHQG
ncbi:MAG: LLM class F420-dependent oxidoreductase [Deltaproteobacteria bacterium]|nr:LLM class F420-dependent oxidoreductase [Deltaproteobacteria bacterium]